MKSMLRRLLGCVARFRARIYRCGALLSARIRGGALVWPRTAVASVPVRIDGSGSVAIGEGARLGFRPAPRLGSGEILLQARGRDARIRIGASTISSNNWSIVALSSVEIGESCQIGDQVAIYDCDFHEIDPARRLDGCGEIAPVKIGNNVWLGSRVMVLKGVTIGDNSVIAAMSCVTRSIPPDSVAAGIPAKVIRPVA